MPITAEVSMGLGTGGVGSSGGAFTWHFFRRPKSLLLLVGSKYPTA